MTLTAPSLPRPPAGVPAAARSERIEELQARIRGMESLRLDTRAVPTHPAVAGLLPGGGLREGTVVAIRGSLTLLMAMLAGPSQSGRWAAVVGIPEFGVEAAERFGVALDRLVLVPDPGRQWLTVLGALVEVIGVIAVRPAGRVTAGEAARLDARLRERGAVLLVSGEWPGSDASLGLVDSRWQGLGDGHGALESREAVIESEGRGAVERRRRARLLLPDAGSRFRPAEAGEPGSAEPAAAVGAVLEGGFQRWAG